mmetsp:Transcript_10812/g.19092  ORF Transcript_10812/g.19092 Transcript_10812/m.19092 type:complete len:101 (+) Transcript_10812:1172-1474(+)
MITVQEGSHVKSQKPFQLFVPTFTTKISGVYLSFFKALTSDATNFSWSLALKPCDDCIAFEMKEISSPFAAFTQTIPFAPTAISKATALEIAIKTGQSSS